MRSSTKLVLSLALVSLVACKSESDVSSSHMSRASTSTSMLDGRMFDVRLNDAKGGEKDTLSFANGRFHSSACDAYGFGSGAYTTSAGGDGLEFHATCKNDAGDVNDWRGTIRGDRVEGSFTWTPARGEKVTRAYSGARTR